MQLNKVEIKVAARDIEFVGLKVKNESIKITFPIGYNINEKTYSISNDAEIKEILEDFKILMRVLESAPTGYFDEGEIKFNFSSAVSIMENYRHNGLYEEQDHITKLDDSGRINWKETMINVKPVLWNRSIVYPEFYMDKNTGVNSTVTEIQKFCLNYINNILWWMFGTAKGALFKNVNINTKTDYMIYELGRKLHEVNDDYSKKIINDMILFLNGTQIVNFSENEEICVGRKYFDKIWERQLKTQIYAEFEKCDDAYPTTYYVFDDKDKIVNNSLFPDIVFKSNDLLIIIDAKYYMIGTFPKSADICKQIFYEKYLRSRYKKIINIFILPNKLEEKYKIKGYALAEGFGEESKIDVCYIDTKLLFKNSNALKELIADIIKSKK